jgi:archaellum component FlaC
MDPATPFYESITVWTALVVIVPIIGLIFRGVFKLGRIFEGRIVGKETPPKGADSATGDSTVDRLNDHGKRIHDIEYCNGRLKERVDGIVTRCADQRKNVADELRRGQEKFEKFSGQVDGVDKAVQEVSKKLALLSQTIQENISARIESIQHQVDNLKP